MKEVRFIIPGKPVGYTATTRNGKWCAGYRKFAEYAKFVRERARRAGIKLPLECSEENPLMINIIAYFPNRRHCDTGNVQKGICDALFYDEVGAMTNKNKKRRRTKKGDDKYTGGLFLPPRYSKTPRAVVIIREYKRKGKQ